MSQSKRGLVRSTAWHHEVSLQDMPYKVLEAMSPAASQMFPVLALQQTKIDKDIINSYEWIYSSTLPVSHIANLLINLNNITCGFITFII